MDTQTETKPKGYECKHALYFTANDGSPHDVLVIKEYAHMPDGRRIPNLRLMYDWKRPFWITREAYRKHKDKKEWEKLERLQKFESTQIKLPDAICRAMGRAPTGNGNIRMLARSPYIYGCDASSALLAKRHYMDKWPECRSDNSVAVLDSETDMVHGHEEIIMLSLTMVDKVKIVIVEDFFRGTIDPEAKIRAAIQKYLGDPDSEVGDLISKRNLKFEIEWARNAGECVFKIISTAHQWQPDILAIWNMNFDVPKMNSALIKYGYDLADVWSDPRIPRPFRQFNYKEGPAQKVTASGKTMALAPAEQWHEVQCPASFYVLDAMCVYLKLRIAKGKDASYALDYILKKHKVGGKLKFNHPDVEKLRGGAWHKYMQENYKPEYCVYNIVDCIMMEILDEKITDLRRMISLMCGHSEYARFPSQPKRTCDDLYFFALQHGMVTATTSDKMQDELDQHVVGLDNWIVTLPSYLVNDDGIAALEELPNVRTNMRAHVADLDVEGTYPNIEIIANISKETTAQELTKIQGIPEQLQRAIGINLSGGHVNAVEIAVKAFGAPTMDELLTRFNAHLNGIEAAVEAIPSARDSFMDSGVVEENAEDEETESED